jgi:hypothetical protein
MIFFEFVTLFPSKKLNPSGFESIAFAAFRG